MKQTMVLVAAIAVFCLSGAAEAAAPDAASARAFVQKLYAHYPSPANGPFFNPTDKDAPSVFDPGLIAAFREDARLSKGEVGFVDADPLCQCQDDGGMTTKIASVTLKGANAADVTVDLLFPGGKANPLTLHLVTVNGNWRVYDLSAPDTKSYRADLMKANKNAAAGH
ncbi:MAG: DUF3828 domain-containing protein [Rhizomicrobium sp.]